jgi:hypothetical protein
MPTIEAYDGLGGERHLKYAMLADSVSSSSHPIGILMSAAGRFVVCFNCHLSVQFPAGAHYDLIARQVESHLYGSQRPLKDSALFGKTITADAAASEALSRSDFDHNATSMRVFDSSTLAFTAAMTRREMPSAL